MSRHILRSLVAIVLVAGNLAPSVVGVRALAAPVPATRATTAVAPAVSGLTGLGASGEPAPDNTFYYGGPAIILTDGTLHDFDASEKVQVFLGTQITGTQLITASAAANGTLRTSVPVPQVFPGSYLLTAYGIQSTHWYTVAVPIGPIVRPSVTQGTSGTSISLSGSGFQPNESVSVYTYYTDTQHSGHLPEQHDGR